MSVNAAIPWWEALPADFHRQPDGTELDARHPLMVRGTAAADIALRSALSAVIVAASAPHMVSARRLAQEREQLAFYAELARGGDADQVFLPPGPVTVRQSAPKRLHYRPRGIAAVDLQFDSPFVPRNPALRDRYLAQKRNRTAWAQHWTHPDGPRKTLIFVHGIIEGWYGLNSVWFALKWFYRQGYDVVQVTLPFHGYRREAHHPFSGYGFLGGGLPNLNEAMLQSICDLRVIADYLRAQGAPSVGISGLSLGGYLSALLAVVDPRLAFCIPNSPLVSPIDMARDWQPSGLLLKAVMWKNGMSIDELRSGLAVHSPLSYAPKVDAKRVMVIGGAGDRFTPPRFVRLLHQHWPGSHLHWFPGNHVIHLQQRKYLKLMRWFMERHTQD